VIQNDYLDEAADDPHFLVASVFHTALHFDVLTAAVSASVQRGFQRYWTNHTAQTAAFRLVAARHRGLKK
jgi:hypothetical protein